MLYLASSANACYGTPQLQPKEVREDVPVIQYWVLAVAINKAKTLVALLVTNTSSLCYMPAFCELHFTFPVLKDQTPTDLGDPTAAIQYLKGV